MKIGIVTQALLGNYGGVLQNYALQKTLRDMGHEPMTIDYALVNSPYRLFRYRCKALIKNLLGGKVLWPSRRRSRSAEFESFVDKHIVVTHTVERYTPDLIERYSMQAVVVGSDQVWRPKYNRYLEDMYLRFASQAKVKRVAYAASFGVEAWEYNGRQTRECGALVAAFDAVSVREASGVGLCRDHLSYGDAVEVLDPTLLLRGDDYAQLCADVAPAPKPFIAVYMLGRMTDERRALLDALKAKTGLEARFFTSYSDRPLTIEEWLATFRDAAFVLTDSFHGTVFSILNHKPFVTLVHRGRGRSRLDSLLGRLGLTERLADDAAQVDVEAVLATPDYEAVEALLDKAREASKSFLIDSLACDAK
jgi:hypothetical protein